MWAVVLLAQADDGGFQVPQSTLGWFWFLVFAAVIAVLWIVVGRTRKRHEQEYWERKRREREDRPPEP
jgi:hypothetical protein